MNSKKCGQFLHIALFKSSCLAATLRYTNLMICIELSWRNNRKARVFVCTLQMADLQTDNEDVQRSVQQLKKKCQKMTAELQDTKLHLEGLQSRNHDLEKKQRKSVPVLSPFSVCPFSHREHIAPPLFRKRPLWPTRQNTNVFFHLNSDWNVL